MIMEIFHVRYCLFMFFFFKQKTAYEVRISDWSSDVCSSDLFAAYERLARPFIEGNQNVVQEGRTTLMPKTQEELDARNAVLRGERTAEKTVLENRKDDRHRIYNAIDLPSYQVA